MQPGRLGERIGRVVLFQAADHRGAQRGEGRVDRGQGFGDGGVAAACLPVLPRGRLPQQGRGPVPGRGGERGGPGPGGGEGVEREGEPLPPGVPEAVHGCVVLPAQRVLAYHRVRVLRGAHHGHGFFELRGARQFGGAGDIGREGSVVRGEGPRGVQEAQRVVGAQGRLLPGTGPSQSWRPDSAVRRSAISWRVPW